MNAAAARGSDGSGGSPAQVLLSSADDFLTIHERVKRELLRVVTELEKPAAGEQKPAETVENQITAILKRGNQNMLTALDAFGERVSSRAPYLSSAVVREAQTLLSGFVDESLLYHPSNRLWRWRDCLLEEARFGSRGVGETFFENLNEILQGQGGDRLSLLPLYLAMLRMGFQGRFRGSGQHDEIDRLRGIIIGRLRESGGFEQTGGSSLSPSAYESTVANIPVIRMPLRGTWGSLLAFALVVMLGLSSGLWFYLESPLLAKIEVILERLETADRI